MRTYIVYAPGLLKSYHAKTAHGVIMYSKDKTLVVVDPDYAGATLRSVVPYLNRDAPIVATIDEALRYGATSLLIGVAPPGGSLPVRWRVDMLTALRFGVELVNGLHEILGDDPEFAAAARAGGTTIWDVRVPPDVPLFSGAAYGVRARVILTVGSDCASGKMTASLELVKAAQHRREKPVFVPTGQTGIMIAGWGIAVDRVISDFTAGAAEQLVLQGAARGDLLFVEGQGAINHPAYGAVTLGLMLGSAPDALVLVHDVHRVTMANFDTPVLPLPRLIQLYEEIGNTVKPAPVVAISLNTGGCTTAEAKRHIAEAFALTGLPVDDVVRNGPARLYDAIAAANIGKTLPLTTAASPA